MGVLTLAALGLVLALLHLPVAPAAWSVPALLPLLARLSGSPAVAALLSVLACSALGYLQLWRDRVLPLACERQLVTVTGEVRGLVAHERRGHGSSYRRFMLAVDTTVPRSCAGPRRLQLYWSDAPPLRAGDRLRLEVRLRRPWGAQNPFTADTQLRYLLAGIHGTGSVRGARQPGAGDASLAARLDARRDALSRAMRAAVPGDAGALLAAVLVGDRRGLTEQHWSLLRSFGITHLMVISGMHISLVAALGWALGRAAAGTLLPSRWCRSRRWVPALLALTLALAYGGLAGFAVPTLRALGMLLPSLLLLPLGRRLGAGRLLAAALLSLLAFRPAAVLGASLWLSVLAVGFLLWSAAWQPPAGTLRRGFFAQGFMLVAMLPISLHLFSGAATVGGLLNLVAVPMVTLGTVPLGLAGVALHALAPGLAAWSWSLAALPLGLLHGGMRFWQPLVEAHTVLGATGAGVGALLLALTGVLALPLPRSWRRGAIAGLLLLPLISAGGPGPAGRAEVTVFDVGQGTAVLVRSRGHAMLYDTGGGGAVGPDRARRVILPFLRAAGIRSLDLLVISHLDADHSAGLETLRAALPIGELWAGPAGVPGARRCRAGRTRALGDELRIQTLSTALPGDSDNNTSCVIRVLLPGGRLLLPGDIDRSRERQLVARWGAGLAAEILVSAHHGSATSSSRLWLRHVRPGDVIFTAERANRFGHPAAAVRAAVAQASARQWTTALHGALTIRFDGRGYRIRPTRHRLRPVWWLWERREFGAAYACDC